jgi:excisionase family DNA binding protein
MADRTELEESFLTVADVATMLQLNPQTVRNWIDQGSLPAIKVGRRVRIKRSDFDRLISNGASSAARAAAAPSRDVPSADDFWSGEPVGSAEPPTANGSAEPPATAEIDSR